MLHPSGFQNAQVHSSIQEVGILRIPKAKGDFWGGWFLEFYHSNGEFQML